jgi:hypothetical protein
MIPIDQGGVGYTRIKRRGRPRPRLAVVDEDENSSHVGTGAFARPAKRSEAFGSAPDDGIPHHEPRS